MLVPERAASIRMDASVAVIGAGFIGRGLIHRLWNLDSLAPPLVVNRDADKALRALIRAGCLPESVLISDDPAVLTQAIAEGRPSVTTHAEVLPEVGGISLVVEATGAMEYGTRVMLQALEAGRHVVSMNAEADALLGHLLDRVAAASGTTYSMADGDQPGVLLRMIDETHRMGLEVAAALNCKRNLDVHQTPEDSASFALRDGTSLAMTTAFGDGTKMQIENVVTANLSGLVPPPIGTPGLRTELATVATDAVASGLPFGSVHHTLGGDFGGGVVVLASPRDAEFDVPYLRYAKLGDGPWYPLFRPYHLIHMEVPTTIEQVLSGGPALGRRTTEPVASCVAVAKRDLTPGEPLDGIGGATVYGLAAPSSGAAELLPIGLSQHARLARAVSRDRPIALDDVELEQTAYLVRLIADSGDLRGSR
jgi:predicted homoserine dehydrogenase-like protein